METIAAISLLNNTHYRHSPDIRKRLKAWYSNSMYRPDPRAIFTSCFEIIQQYDSDFGRKEIKSKKELKRERQRFWNSQRYSKRQQSNFSYDKNYQKENLLAEQADAEESIQPSAHQLNPGEQEEEEIVQETGPMFEIDTAPDPEMVQQQEAVEEECPRSIRDRSDSQSSFENSSNANVGGKTPEVSQVADTISKGVADKNPTRNSNYESKRVAEKNSRNSNYDNYRLENSYDDRYRKERSYPYEERYSRYDDDRGRSGSPYGRRRHGSRSPPRTYSPARYNSPRRRYEYSPRRGPPPPRRYERSPKRYNSPVDSRNRSYDEERARSPRRYYPPAPAPTPRDNSPVDSRGRSPRRYYPPAPAPTPRDNSPVDSRNRSYEERYYPPAPAPTPRDDSPPRSKKFVRSYKNKPVRSLEEEIEYQKTLPCANGDACAVMWCINVHPRDSRK